MGQKRIQETKAHDGKDDKDVDHKVGGERRKHGPFRTMNLNRTVQRNAPQTPLPFLASRSIFRASILSHFRYLGRGAARHQGRGLVVWGKRGSSPQGCQSTALMGQEAWETDNHGWEWRLCPSYSHTALLLGVGAPKLGLVQTVDTGPTVLHTQAAPTVSTPCHPHLLAMMGRHGAPGCMCQGPSRPSRL